MSEISKFDEYFIYELQDLLSFVQDSLPHQHVDTFVEIMDGILLCRKIF